MLLRLALYSTLGYLLSVLGYSLHTTEFWCFIALYWAAEQVTRIELIAALRQQVAEAKQKDKQGP